MAEVKRGAMVPRKNSSKATLRRAEHLHRIINELRNKQLLIADIPEFIPVSLSAATRHIQDLRNADIVVVARRINQTQHSIGQAFFKLHPDLTEKRVNRFLYTCDSSYLIDGKQNRDRPRIVNGMYNLDEEADDESKPAPTFASRGHEQKFDLHNLFFKAAPQ